MVLKYGPYKGKAIDQVAREDYEYLKELSETTQSPHFKEKLIAAITTPSGRILGDYQIPTDQELSDVGF